MTTHLIAAMQLLHTPSYGVLATHSEQIAGYPFATVLPFVPDELHRPVLLVSALAEHTRNLHADMRASFLVAAGDSGNVLREARLTLVGDAERFEPSSAMVARYVRYRPDARRYLQLGDFSFYRLAVKRARYIAGFGEMGWVEHADWSGAMSLSLSEEDTCIADLAAFLPGHVRLLGIDCYGIDIERQGKRERYVLPNAPVEPGALGRLPGVISYRFDGFEVRRYRKVSRCRRRAPHRIGLHHFASFSSLSTCSLLSQK